MTASLRPFYSCGRSSPTNIESTCFQILSPSIWIIGACSYNLPISLDSRTNTSFVALWLVANGFEVFDNTISYCVIKRSTEQRVFTLSFP